MINDKIRTLKEVKNTLISFVAVLQKLKQSLISLKPACEAKTSTVDYEIYINYTCSGTDC